MALFSRKKREKGMEEPLHRLEEREDRSFYRSGSEEVGRSGLIGKTEVQKAEQTLQRYKMGKTNLEARIIDNEEWFKLQHWDLLRKNKNPGDPEPASAWLFNSIANKHADAMDNYPEPTVLPREKDDEKDAELLSEILPVVLEQNQFDQTYNNMWWYKLKTGTGVLGVFWDPKKNNGLGDINIRALDLLNLFWEPGITDVQKSRNFFHVELVDADLMEQEYPFLKDALSAPTIDIAKYIYDDTVDTSDKVAVIDWYYKVVRNGKEILHFCKFCNGEVLYASENDPAYAERGFYDHGKYPFIFDALFPEAGSPAGFGYVDVCKSPQLYIDKLDQVILKHAAMGARPRFLVRGDGNVNEEEYADWTKDFVHYYGSGDPKESVFPLEMPSLHDVYVSVRNLKVEELKETSGNRDFSQGGTSSGVTAASAIAALQEAGSKLSRDIIKSSYRAFAQLNYFCIDLMRQFYQEERWFRVIGKRGEMEYRQFNGQQIAAKPQGNDFGLDMGFRTPIFDVKVTSQKSSPFSTVAQNERAKELYGMGFFRPDLADQALAALDMMDFEGIEAVRERIAQNGTLYQQLREMQSEMIKMAAIIDAQNGSTITQGIVKEAGVEAASPNPSQRLEANTNSLGESFEQAMNSRAGQARAQAAKVSMPR